ncbi:MAG TPA: bifunctional DNA-formamidopyrimidine glycosylase/DNA-(apurinic or apyrimidinic site) lyase [Trueperaceae bacterium]|nr:bifunctional DNA-formamidopyrimidine glycosylase/DNA-(apurinic or apyrimidinic site) lyase [Trueperaceae bacterium]
MPELPEVETVRRELAPWLTGRTVLAAERLAPPGPKYRDLERSVGQTIERVERRGKFLILPLSGGDEMILHLGMTGVVSSVVAGEGAGEGAGEVAAGPPAGGAPTHVRVRLRLSGDPPSCLHFRDARRFGRMLVVRAGAYDGLPTLARMGPEPLSGAFTLARFRRELARSGTAIKTYLLSQRPVAGVGNIYADEALWRARVHPETPARRVSRAKAAALRSAVREVLLASIEAHGTTLNDYRTVNGEVGAYLEQLAAYGHAEEPCPRCGALLRRSVVGQRGTVYCPRCQRRR